ncbi:MAG: 30S ribosomal protein S10 [Candidatus Caenarcaniphilales bacterium]|nr:30S ribosomal protein S10 [Candidatus Caenarcaniphilales bacterium]
MSKTKTKKNSASSSGISSSSKVRIRLKSFDARQIDSVTKGLAEIIEKTGAEISGPIPLPTKRRRYCVNSSTHVDKRSGEHFEIRVHNRLIEIINPLDETMVALQKMDLPSGVGVKVQVLEAKN